MFEFFKEESRYIYHFTSSNIAINFITKNSSLKISRYTTTNDPKETKNWHFHIGVNPPYSCNLSRADMNELSIKLGYRLKNTANVLCFSKDRKLTGDHVKDIYNRGFCKPRMWAHYGDNHKGVCLIFDKEILTKEIFNQFYQKKTIYSGHVQYVNRNVIDEPFVSSYCIDYEHLELVGFEQYVLHHISTHLRRLFFEKAIDWITEDEYRWVLFGKESEDLYINYGDSLKGVVFGNDCCENDITAITSKLYDKGIFFEQLIWKNCTPWYSFKRKWN